MLCKACGSENSMNLKGEITASFPRLEDAEAAPIYFVENISVCLDCGFAEVRVPAAQLDLLKQSKKLASKSRK
jgi:hypothetical protein